MKKSKMALMYGTMCFLLPVILLMIIYGFGAPRSPNVDGVDYGAAALIVSLLSGSSLVALVSGFLVIKGRNKNKSDLILYALVFSAMLTILYLAYPPYAIMPISVSIVGYFAYREVSQLEKSGSGSTETPSNV